MLYSTRYMHLLGATVKLLKEFVNFFYNANQCVPGNVEQCLKYGVEHY